MKKKYRESDSDPDEPDELQDSSDDPAWNPTEEDSGKRRSGRLRSARISNRKRQKTTEKKSPEKTEKKKEKKEKEKAESEEEEEEVEDDEEEEEEEEEEETPNSTTTTTKTATPTPAPTSTVSSTTTPSMISGPPILNRPFQPGAYVILKTDMESGSKDPPIWKIDGKALLQKYLPTEIDGKLLYKNSSTYSGWTQQNRDMYLPAPVRFKVQNRKETIVEFLRDQVVMEKKDEDSE